MTVDIEKMRRDIRLESWKVAAATVVALAAAVGAGVATGNYFTKQQPQSLPLQIIFQPGSIVAPPVPAAAPK